MFSFVSSRNGRRVVRIFRQFTTFLHVSAHAGVSVKRWELARGFLKIKRSQSQGKREMMLAKLSSFSSTCVESYWVSWRGSTYGLVNIFNELTEKSFYWRTPKRDIKTSVVQRSFRETELAKRVLVTLICVLIENSLAQLSNHAFDFYHNRSIDVFPIYFQDLWVEKSFFFLKVINLY